MKRKHVELSRQQMKEKAEHAKLVSSKSRQVQQLQREKEKSTQLISKLKTQHKQDQLFMKRRLEQAFNAQRKAKRSVRTLSCFGFLRHAQRAAGAFDLCREQVPLLPRGLLHRKQSCGASAPDLAVASAAELCEASDAAHAINQQRLDSVKAKLDEWMHSRARHKVLECSSSAQQQRRDDLACERKQLRAQCDALEVRLGREAAAASSSVGSEHAALMQQLATVDAELQQLSKEHSALTSELDAFKAERVCMEAITLTSDEWTIEKVLYGLAEAEAKTLGVSMFVQLLELVDMHQQLSNDLDLAQKELQRTQQQHARANNTFERRVTELQTEQEKKTLMLLQSSRESDDDDSRANNPSESLQLVSQKDKQISSLKAQVSGLHSHIATLEVGLSALSDGPPVPRLESSVTASPQIKAPMLRQRLDELKARRLSAVGQPVEPSADQPFGPTL